MIRPGISFVQTAPALAVDPNRMDTALFVGLLPPRAGGEAARQGMAARLAAQGWEGRADADLRDVPVRVRSLGEVEALWDTGGRIDRIASVRGLGLSDIVEIADVDAVVGVNVDGRETPVELGPGPIGRHTIVAALDAIDGISVGLGPADAAGRAGLVVRRTAGGAGSLTVHANASLGFPVAARDVAGVGGCSTGAALRAFFAAGGREAVVVAMGDPSPQFSDSASRLAALQRLIPGAGPGGAPPGLPGAYPPRTPWHGLAHLHGLPDIAMVLLPDLADLVAEISAVAAEPDVVPRPLARFVVCVPDSPASATGEARPGMPARADADGMARWGDLAAWVARETARITPEAMAVLAAPLPADGADTALVETVAGLTHPQLQVAAPWIATGLFADMPGRAAPACGLLAGTIAASTLAAGAWRAVAGTRLPQVERVVGASPRLRVDTAPALSVIGQAAAGVTILSDRTTDPGTYSQANVRRLMALVLRAARHRGEGTVFEANGPATWAAVRRAMTALMRGLHRAGALAGLRESDAFQILCGPETMGQSDIDAGRVVAEVRLRPAASLEAIDVRLVARGGPPVPGEIA